MKRILKSIGSRLLRIYSKYDPLAFQKRYAANTLRVKRQSVCFETMDDETISKVKTLWGG